MEITKNTDKEFDVRFHYCPYVNFWLKLGKKTEELSNLCDICMLGDQATAEKFDKISFHPGCTIAKGNSFCDLKYTKNE